MYNLVIESKGRKSSDEEKIIEQFRVNFFWNFNPFSGVERIDEPTDPLLHTKFYRLIADIR